MRLLEDRAGVYGVAADGGSDPCILTRPDRVEPTRDRIAYQMIVPNHAAFRRTNEQKLYRQTHLALLAKAGVTPDWEHYADVTVRQRDRLRRTYFGLGRQAARITNRALAEALSAADPKLLRVVRRYPIRFRAQLYTACATMGTRVTQFCETFPVVALLFFTRQFRSQDLEETRRMREEGRQMILRGERLGRIAAFVGFSMVFRRVHPGAAEQAVVTEASDELVASCLPQSLPAQRRWFGAVSRASQFGADFIDWTARRVGEMASSRKQTLAELGDIGDWVRACQQRTDARDGFAPPHDTGARFVTRPFCREMSLRTVRRLTRQWHEAVADGMRASDCVRFPRPPLPGSEMGEFRIVPITDSSALYLEGKSLHHCAATYQQDIVDGKCWIYSVRRCEERIATFAVQADDDGARLGQIRGTCNSKPDSSCERAIQEWFRQHSTIGH